MLPIDYVERMKALLGQEAERFLATYQQPRSFGLRVNTLKLTPDDLISRLPFKLQSVPWCDSGFYYPGDQQLGKHPYHAAGLYYLQDPGAMAVAELAAPKPGERVLDLCAAPGGKSTQLIALMQDQGLLVANELYPARARILAENLERWGAKQAVVTSAEPAQLAERFGSYFDCVVVDAPCSGEGMFRKDPDAAGYWSIKHVLECAKLQADILQSAYRLLASGGRLVYSTCTFALEENEQNVQRFLQQYPDMELLPARMHPSWQPGITEGTGVELARTARLWPHYLAGEGHFLALLRKAGDHGATSMAKPVSLPLDVPPTLSDFCGEALNFTPAGPFIQYGDFLYQAPSLGLPDFSGLRVLRPGWPLGELRKGRFLPSHALALSCQLPEVRRSFDLPAASQQVQEYLRGHTLPANLPNGWALVTVDDFPLGWGKVVNRVLKNHYPKGLRWLGNSKWGHSSDPTRHDADPTEPASC